MKKLLLPVASLVFLCGCQTAQKAPLPTSSKPAASADPFWPPGGIFEAKGRTSSWSGFRATNLERRTLFAEHASEDQNGIVFVGDSIIEGWQTLSQDFANLHVKVVNRGIGGDTTPNLLYRLNSDVLALHPRALVILIGTNDLGEHTPAADIADNLRIFLGRVRDAYPRIPIAWCLVMPRGADDTYPERIPGLNHLIETIAASDSKVTICDTFSPLVLPDGSSRAEYFHPDHLHPNAAGYAVWKGVIDPVLVSWSLGSK